MGVQTVALWVMGFVLGSLGSLTVIGLESAEALTRQVFIPLGALFPAAVVLIWKLVGELRVACHNAASAQADQARANQEVARLRAELEALRQKRLDDLIAAVRAFVGAVVEAARDEGDWWKEGKKPEGEEGDEE